MKAGAPEDVWLHLLVLCTVVLFTSDLLACSVNLWIILFCIQDDGLAPFVVAMITVREGEKQ